jgi:hypothetical protein
MHHLTDLFVTWGFKGYNDAGVELTYMLRYDECTSEVLKFADKILSVEALKLPARLN